MTRHKCPNYYCNDGNTNRDGPATICTVCDGKGYMEDPPPKPVTVTELTADGWRQITEMAIEIAQVAIAQNHPCKIAILDTAIKTTKEYHAFMVGVWKAGRRRGEDHPNQTISPAIRNLQAAKRKVMAATNEGKDANDTE